MFELDFSVIPANSSLLWEGIKMTFLLTGLAIVGGIILGTFLALLRIAKIPVLSQFSAAYVNFFRSLPLILVIFWLFFLVPLIVGRPVGAFSSVLVAFILFEAAYYSEIIRAGINSVRLGQLAAARAMGLTYIQSMRYVILPQAFRAMTPILLTQAIILFQDTSLVYVVGLRDFLVSAEIVANRDQRLVEMFLFVALVYFVFCFAASLGVKYLQKRINNEL
ncbi:MAG: ABC transporter permease subunit [Thiotrichales bacterium]|jgi:glutamate/aspartate transport system permease protein|uniref:Glutamate/aspartate import permease protein GltK n=1 Tax=Candidatus Pseudothioglobus singularis PS1 TaxID=1125411 RepID=A0A0M3T1X7_9GAMM|nr:ABC transporter permease subunit [Candidatus Pseudothioglobus singularis]MBT3456526.1 ABC transporter permease subunit [Thiotrichales bacterium]MBT5978310.1 ABC transporter permease subunit [Gammaproteobacteria bacterium]MDG1344833.1 ABC transporter permease subunit [Candidatus Thioglobus sp.]ALE01775.1 glutamate/aspartate transporter permease GltK [Candidatus Pseudothioglobus singularis PS1]ANQ66449.1 amino acid ABC transporter permease [Candidatus Pseudothioglobus singularis]|tara:strand:- start:628 stop:1290 length:663 start_codon:yes stop_codon:yes gene_type:complete